MDKLPAHKVIPGTTFTVDGFRNVSPAVTAYFLSHAHSGEDLKTCTCCRASGRHLLTGWWRHIALGAFRVQMGLHHAQSAFAPNAPLLHSSS